MAFLVRIYPAAYPPTDREVAFVWSAAPSATSYLLRVGTASGLTDVCHLNVGNVITYPLTLTPRHYWSNVVPMIGTEPQTPLGEQEITV